MESKGSTHEKNSSLPELGSLFPYKKTIFYFWYMWDWEKKEQKEKHKNMAL